MDSGETRLWYGETKEKSLYSYRKSEHNPVNRFTHSIGEE